MRKHDAALALAMMCAGWAASMTVGHLADLGHAIQFVNGLDENRLWLLLHQIAPWPIGALATGIALRRVWPRLRGGHVALLTVGLTLTAPFSWPLSLPFLLLQRIRFTSTIAPTGVPLTLPGISLQRLSLFWIDPGGVANWTMGLILGALIVALTLRYADRRITLPHVALLTAAWAAARLSALGIPQAPTGRTVPIVEGVGSPLAALLNGFPRGALFGLLGGVMTLAVLSIAGRTQPLPASDGPRPVRSATQEPYFLRITRNSALPTLSHVLVGTAALFAASMGVGVWVGSHAAGSIPVRTLAEIGLTALVVIPLLIAPCAAFITAQNTRSADFHLLRLTSLTARTIVRSSTLAALYRLRVLIGLAVGLAPLIISGNVLYLLRISRMISSAKPALIPTTLILAAIPLGLLAANMLSAVLGVAAGLALRRAPAVAAGLAPVGIGLVVFPMLVTIIGGAQFTRTVWLSESVALLAFALTPLLLSVEIARAATVLVWPGERLRLSLPPILWDASQPERPTV
jgi:hypothetical protein